MLLTSFRHSVVVKTQFSQLKKSDGKWMALMLLMEIFQVLGAHGQTLQYYFPFDGTLANQGAAGGAAMPQGNGEAFPTTSNLVAPSLGSSHSESFAGATSVALPNSEKAFLLNSGGCMTISFWVYFDDLSKGCGIANKCPDATTPGWIIWVSTNGTVHYQWTSQGQVASNATKTTLSAHKWVTITLVSGSAVGGVKIYFNGQPQPMLNPYAGTGSLDDSSSYPIRVGALGVTGGSTQECLNDYAMWDGILSEGKIAALYNLPTLVSGYNVGVLNQLFNAYDNKSSVTIGDLTWNYVSRLHVKGHQLGEAWSDDDNFYNLWLGVSDDSASGLQASHPQILR